MKYFQVTTSDDSSRKLNTEYGYISFQEWLKREKERIEKLGVECEIRQVDGKVALYAERVKV